METIRIGNSGVYVTLLASQLQKLGYYTGINNGFFSNELHNAVITFQKAKGLEIDGIVGDNTWSNIWELTKTKSMRELASRPLGIEYKDIPLEGNEFNSYLYPKTQIYLHHTASGGNPYNVQNCWENDGSSQVATAFIIGGEGRFDGEILRVFPEYFWAWHLASENSNQNNDRISIGIEICNWGWLKESNGKFYTWTGAELDNNQVYDLGYTWRGCRYFHKYTEAQITSVCKLVKALANKYEIALHKERFEQRNWFELNSAALNGFEGVWTHANVRSDKLDIYPDIRLIQALGKI